MSKKNKANVDTQSHHQALGGGGGGGNSVGGSSSLAAAGGVRATSRLAWKLLSPDELAQLGQLDPEQTEAFLAVKFDLREHETDLLEAALLDFYTTQYWWARHELKLAGEQLSSYFTIAHTLMESVRERRTVGAAATLDESVLALQGELCEAANEASVRQFSDEQLSRIVSHLALTFFQQHRLFAHAFHHAQAQIVVRKEIGVECPLPPDLPYPAPLDEAMTESMYNKYVLHIDEEQQERTPLSDETSAALEQDPLDALHPDQVQLSDEVIEQIRDRFDGLSTTDAKKIIFEMTEEMVAELKADLRKQIKERDVSAVNGGASTEQSKTRAGGKATNKK